MFVWSHRFAATFGSRQPDRVIFLSRVPSLAIAIAALVGGTLQGADLDWIQGGKEVASGEMKISEGVVSLEWREGTELVELRHLRPDKRETIHTITGDHKTVVSGMDEGDHEFQLRVPGGEWGGVMAVTNTFMDRNKVVWLLISGGLVVVFIIGGIVAGMWGGKGEA